MGTCSCEGEHDTKQVLFIDGPVQVEQRSVEHQAQKEERIGEKQEQVRIDGTFGDPPGTGVKTEEGRNAYSEQNVLALQCFARIFLAKKSLAQRQQSTLDWSDDESLPSELKNDAPVIDPTVRLSEKARETLHRKSPLQFSNDIRGVRANSAKELTDGSIYLGQWTVLPNGNWLRKGKGRHYTLEGGYREGYWKNGKLHQYGREVLPSGDYYEGEFKDDRRDGRGKLESFDGKSWYSGDWKQGQRHGNGTEVYVDGSRYEGDFLADRQDGEGTFTYPESNEYRGHMKQGLFNGKGVFKWHDGRVYDGDWQMGKMHGRGKCTYADGKMYEGEYQNEKKHGFGIYEWEGMRYEGEWHQGRMHGKGWLEDKKKGERRQYYFKDGKRGEPIPS